MWEARKLTHAKMYADFVMTARHKTSKNSPTEETRLISVYEIILKCI